MAGLSLEERVNWNIIEYSKLLRGEESAVDVVSDHDASAVVPHEYDHDEERQLQAGVVWELQEFVFENCIFQHNKQGDVGEFTKFGVVSVELEFDIGTFVNCTFYNNSHGNAVRNQSKVLKSACHSCVETNLCCRFFFYSVDMPSTLR